MAHTMTISNFKRTGIGLIPRDWDHVRVGDIARVKGGKRLPAGFALTDTPTPHPYLRVTDMRSGGINQSQLKYVPKAAFPAIRNYRIYHEDIFISVAGTLGIVGVVPPRLSGASLTENANRLTDIQCDRDYLKHWLMSEPIQQVIESVRTVGAQPKLALGRIENFSLAIPRDANEQRAIAETLADVDELIHALETLITKKRAIQRATMQQLLTGKTRLPGSKGKWKDCQLGTICTFLPTASNPRSHLHNNGDVDYVHYGDVHAHRQPVLNCSSCSLPRIAAQRVGNAAPLQNGDLVMVDASEDIDGVGKSVEVQEITDRPVVAGLHTILCRGDDNAWASGFKAYLQFIPAFRSILARLAAGTSVYAISAKQLASVELRLPSRSEQAAIVSVLSDMDAEIAAIGQRLDKTCAVKQGMMQQLLTGRVRLVEPEVAATAP